MFIILNMTDTKTTRTKDTLETLTLEITRWLSRRNVTAGNDIAAFQRMMDENAVDALIHSKSAIVAAGKKSVIDQALETMQRVFVVNSDGPRSLWELSRVANVMLLRLARDVSDDRSPVSALVHSAKCAQWAEIAEMISDELSARSLDDAFAALAKSTVVGGAAI